MKDSNHTVDDWHTNAKYIAHKIAHEHTHIHTHTHTYTYSLSLSHTHKSYLEMEVN